MEAGTNVNGGSCVGDVPLFVKQEAPSLTPILRVHDPFSHLSSNTLNYLHLSMRNLSPLTTGRTYGDKPRTNILDLRAQLHCSHGHISTANDSREF